MTIILHHLKPLPARCRTMVAWFLRDRTGSVSLIFAFSLVPMIVAVAVAVDLSRLANGRAILQRAVDSAALSGAAAYSVNAAAAQTRAVVMATSSFCETTAILPPGLTKTGGLQACGGTNNPGAVVTTQIGGFKAGTPGIASSSCSATTPVVGGGITCGFIVSVSAQATMTTMIPTYFGVTKAISVSAIAANPFINIGNAITAQINGSARYSNNLWIYPLLLDSNGNPDFNTNPGAIPGLPTTFYAADATPNGCASATDCGSIGTAAGINCTSVVNTSSACSNTSPSGCTNNPLQFTCGAFTMLASTFYNTATNPCLASSPCQPLGAGTYPTIIQGVVQNPQAPSAIITATTPIGIAFQSVSGGNTGYSYTGQPNPTNGCKYPGGTLYTTVSQIYGNTANSITGSTPSNQAMDWAKVTHWFYSSYLANNLPPSYGEILSQSHPQSYTPPGGGSTIYFNTRLPSIGDNSTGSFSPSLASCAAKATNGNSYDEFLMTTYPSSGSTNLSLYILNQPANATYIPAASTGYAGQSFTPASTPGYQYAALSCAAYGNNVFTFYWNDMGGNAAFGNYNDDKDYGNGTIRVSCNGASFVLLIG